MIQSGSKNILHSCYSRVNCSPKLILFIVLNITISSFLIFISNSDIRIPLPYSLLNHNFSMKQTDNSSIKQTDNSSMKQTDNPSIKQDQNVSSIRIFCFILTYAGNLATKARAVNLTWAPRFDKYLFISETTNGSKGLPIAPLANLTSDRWHLTQKSTSALLYTYEQFYNDFDWFMKADDDTYVFVDNLRAFLKTKNTSDPVTFGYNFRIIVPNGYHSGGGGYVLSKESLRRFYEAHHDNKSNCAKNGGSEDVEIASCLRKKGVRMGRSTDRYNRERFHALAFNTHYNGPTGWIDGYAENPPVTGKDCCSDGTITFHYVTAEQQYLIDRMHYGFHNKDVR